MAKHPQFYEPLQLHGRPAQHRSRRNTGEHRASAYENWLHPRVSGETSDALASRTLTRSLGRPSVGLTSEERPTEKAETLAGHRSLQTCRFPYRQHHRSTKSRFKIRRD